MLPKQDWGDWLQGEEGVAVLGAGLLLLAGGGLITGGLFRGWGTFVLVLGAVGIFGGLFILWRLKRAGDLKEVLGEVAWEWDTQPPSSDEMVAPGAVIRCDVSLCPVAQVEITGATLRLEGIQRRSYRAKHRVREKDGRYDVVTRTHEYRELLGSDEASLSGPRAVGAGQPVKLNAQVTLPSSAGEDKEGVWSLILTISLAGFPDWVDEILLEVQR